MGCYNYTCALSRIPIISGNPVALLIIVEDSRRITLGNAFDPMGQWAVVGYPIYAKYNDYGWVEDVEDSPLINYTLSEINKNLVEKEVGENEYWDLAVNRGDVTDLESLHKFLHADRITFKNYLGHLLGQPKEMKVSYVMIHRGIFDKFVGDLYTHKDYDGDLKDYVTVTFEDKVNYLKNKYDKLAEMREALKLIEDKTSDDYYDLVFEISTMTRDDFTTRDFRYQVDYIAQSCPDMEMFYQEFAKIICLSFTMHNLKILMHPQLHAGQDYSTKLYDKWLMVQQDQLNVHKEYFSEWGDDDETY